MVSGVEGRKLRFARKGPHPAAAFPPGFFSDGERQSGVVLRTLCSPHYIFLGNHSDSDFLRFVAAFYGRYIGHGLRNVIAYAADCLARRMLFWETIIDLNYNHRFGSFQLLCSGRVLRQHRIRMRSSLSSRQSRRRFESLSSDSAIREAGTFRKYRRHLSSL